MKTLQMMLGDQPLDQFLSKHFTRLPFSSTGGASSQLHLLNWNIVEEIISGKKSILRVVREGIMTKDFADWDFTQAREFYKRGHTLLIKNAEISSRAFKNLAEDFSKSFHTEVDIQLYCTPEGNNAFGWHYDVEEVFIIQAKGSKLYSIRPNTVHPNPLVKSIPKDQGYEQEKTDIELKVLLKEGDWLYIPSGWWHRALTQSESMHISIGLMPRSAVDIASFLPDYLAHQKFWRTRMPVHQTFESEQDEIDFYQEAFVKLGKDIQTHLGDKEFIKAYVKHIKS